MGLPMKLRKIWGLVIVALSAICWLTVTNRPVDAAASVPATYYSQRDLKKLKFKATSFPKKYRGVWYRKSWNGKVVKLHIYKHKIVDPVKFFSHQAQPAKVRSRAVKVSIKKAHKTIKGYRTAFYTKGAGIQYLGLSKKRLLISLDVTGTAKHALATHVDTENFAYRTAKQARTHAVY